MQRVISLFVITCLLALATCQTKNETIQRADNATVGGYEVPDMRPRIVGGSMATLGQFPWQALLYMNNAMCGGSLVTSTLVITAAHCTFGAREVQVTLGVLNRKLSNEFSRQTFWSRDHAWHPNYRQNGNYINFDIAYVRLPRAVTVNAWVKPIRLPRSAVQSFDRWRARASGFGTNSAGELKYADLTVISNSECTRAHGPYINSAKICVSTTEGSSICFGDSGGPLAVQESDRRFTLIGVSSFVSGSGCSARQPAAFTRVSSYMQDPFLTRQLW